jgi:hypothetical protein
VKRGVVTQEDNPEEPYRCAIDKKQFETYLTDKSGS